MMGQMHSLCPGGKGVGLANVLDVWNGGGSLGFVFEVEVGVLGFAIRFVLEFVFSVRLIAEPNSSISPCVVSKLPV